MTGFVGLLVVVLLFILGALVLYGVGAALKFILDAVMLLLDLIIIFICTVISCLWYAVYKIFTGIRDAFRGL